MQGWIGQVFVKPFFGDFFESLENFLFDFTLVIFRNIIKTDCKIVEFVRVAETSARGVVTG